VVDPHEVAIRHEAQSDAGLISHLASGISLAYRLVTSTFRRSFIYFRFAFATESEDQRI
jgi:hypothetical protein